MTQIVDRTGFISDTYAGHTPTGLDAYTGGESLLLATDDDPGAVVEHFGTLDLIIIPFDKSADGRGFSLAATLRALGYLGHLRARGHILVDQFRAALRSGFDDIEISKEQAARNPEEQWLAVPHGESYQAHILGGSGPLDRARHVAAPR